MNPNDLNVQPDLRGGGSGAGDGSKGNYGMLFSMLGVAGLAAFSWIWNKKSQSEFQKVKAQYELELENKNKNSQREIQEVKAQYELELENKNKNSQREIQEVKAQYELKLENERQIVKVCVQAMMPNKQLVEKQKQQQKDLEKLEEDEHSLGKSARAELDQALERENDWYSQATATLKKLEDQLMERQHLYCSPFNDQEQRSNVEDNMVIKPSKKPFGPKVDLKSDLEDIFQRDTYCANLLNTDKKKNGRLMWEYLRYWELQITIQKHRRAMKSVLEGKSNPTKSD